MFSPTSLEDLALLRETVELECKLAQGPNGQGEVPKDFWPTYSAMANAYGGVVLLGVREKDGMFSVAGIPNPAKVRDISLKVHWRFGPRDGRTSAPSRSESTSSRVDSGVWLS